MEDTKKKTKKRQPFRKTYEITEEMHKFFLTLQHGQTKQLTQALITMYMELHKLHGDVALIATLSHRVKFSLVEDEKEKK